MFGLVWFGLAQFVPEAKFYLISLMLAFLKGVFIHIEIKFKVQNFSWPRDKLSDIKNSPGGRGLGGKRKKIVHVRHVISVQDFSKEVIIPGQIKVQIFFSVDGYQNSLSGVGRRGSTVRTKNVSTQIQGPIFSLSRWSSKTR